MLRVQQLREGDWYEVALLLDNGTACFSQSIFGILNGIFIYSVDIVEWLKHIVFSPDPNATTFYQDTQVGQTQASNANV